VTAPCRSRRPLPGCGRAPNAFHIHEIGKCDLPFESAGEHFNPTGKQHGKDNPNGPHAGVPQDRDAPRAGREPIFPWEAKVYALI
jgi:Copper/zinc superoxide dismutase (SODC)